VLTKEELVAFWRATEDMKRAGSLFGHVYQLLLLTGQRLREIAHMEREELNISDQIFTLSANRSKNGLAHIVHLTPLALGIIASAPIRSKQYVFSYNKNKLSGFSASKRILEQEMQKYLDKPLKPFQLRDLRRTFATGCAELGIDHNIADRILNHVSDAQSGVKGVYQRYEYLPERKAAMITWSSYIENITASVELSVLPF
jgi:integrase